MRVFNSDRNHLLPRDKRREELEEIEEDLMKSQPKKRISIYGPM